MADVSRGRNFWGRLVDGILPGNQYDRQTGQFSNIGSGIAGFVGNQFAPGLGTLFARGWERRGGIGGISQTQLAPQPNFTFDPGTFGRQGMGQPVGGWVGPTEGQAPQPGWGAFTPSFTQPPSQFAGGNSNGGARSRGGGWTGDAAQGLLDGLQQQSRWNSSAASFGDFSQRQG